MGAGGGGGTTKPGVTATFFQVNILFWNTFKVGQETRSDSTTGPVVWIKTCFLNPYPESHHTKTFIGEE